LEAIHVKSDAQVRNELINGLFEFSRHAFQRAAERNIAIAEIREAGHTMQVIERYPDDKYAPSCLILGYTQNRRPLHIQVSLLDAAVLKIITLYEPDQSEWIDDEIRRN